MFPIRRVLGKNLLLVVTVGVAAVSLALPQSAGAASSSGREPTDRAQSFDPVVEAKNYSDVLERQAIYDTPAYQAQLRLIGTQNQLAATEEQANDPQREFESDLCWNGSDGCAGDTRLYDWETKDYGIVRPVLFTARDGAQISGHVWATRNGPAKRPGIVITDGSVQADEQMYWYAAEALAKDGYVVLTFDPQGQGQSDTFGQDADRDEGFPAQTDGRPFYDGTEDAIDFFLSTPSHPYKPVPSCNSGTSHADYQNARVKAGFDAAYNPFWAILNGKKLGLAGHSYGAAGVSYIGQWDKRVKAIVAWDNLAAPNPNVGIFGNTGPAEKGCVDTADRKPAKIHTPALGMSADYFLPPTPNTSLPAYNSKDTESLVYSKHHVDTGEIVIRGGSHLDFSFIPNNGFGASLRGADLVTWYTDAWFDYYVKHQRSAYRRLVTRRWQHDAAEASVDSYGDGNAFSYYYRSRLDIAKPGSGRFDCEDLRRGCVGMTRRDGYAGTWSYLTVDTTRQGKATHPNIPTGTGLYPKDATP
jgi:pimeloyl-ACP methyl ester carboxylesterase